MIALINANEEKMPASVIRRRSLINGLISWQIHCQDSLASQSRPIFSVISHDWAGFLNKT